MDYNRLGHSGLRVPALSFGTATFGGSNAFFKAWGSTDAVGASRLIAQLSPHFFEGQNATGGWRFAATILA